MLNKILKIRKYITNNLFNEININNNKIRKLEYNNQIIRLYDYYKDNKLSGLIIGLYENYFEVLEIKKTLINDKLLSISPFKLNNDKIIYFNNSLLSILNDTNNRNEINIFGKYDQKSFLKNISPQNQIFTGNLSIDYGNPIPEGSFAFIKGSNNIGKTEFIANTLAMNKKYLLIYYNKNKKETDFWENKLKYNIQNKILIHNNTVNDEMETYLNIQLLLSLVKYYKNVLNYNIILAIEDIEKIYYDLLNIFSSNHIFNNSINLFSEILVLTNVKENNSLTTLLTYNSNDKDNLEFGDKIKDLWTHLDSISNIKIDFNNNIDKFNINKKGTIGFKNLVFLKSKWQNNLIKYLTSKISNIISLLKKEYTNDDYLRKLKIHQDPWDRYLILDSEFYLNILYTNKFYNEIEQYFIIHFIVRTFELDYTGFFDIDSKLVIEKYINYISKEKILNKNTPYSYLNLVKNDKDIDLILENLNYSYNSFFDYLKTEGFILKYKKDYFIN